MYELARGKIYRIDRYSFPVGTGRVVVAETDLSDETCPSPFDPCGDPALYPGIEGSCDWWVATDGRAALRVDGGSEPVLTAMDRTGRTLRTLRLDDEIIGVRFHESFGRLLERSP